MKRDLLDAGINVIIPDKTDRIIRMAMGFAWVMSGKDFRQESIDA